MRKWILKHSILVLAILTLSGGLAGAAVWFTVATTVGPAGHGAVNGPAWNLTDAPNYPLMSNIMGGTQGTTTARIKLSLYSSGCQLRGTVGPNTGFEVLSSFPVATSRTSQSYTTRKAYATVYPHYSSIAHVSHVQDMDGISL